MRVLLIEQKTIWGGGQVALTNVLGAWQALGLPVAPVVLCPPHAALVPRVRALGVPVAEWDPGRIEKTRGRAWNAVQRLAPTLRLVQLVRQHRPQILVANGAYALLASLAAARLTRLPTLWIEHTTTLPPGNILASLIGAAHSIVVVSPVTRDQFVSLAPACAAKIRVIPNGVDTTKFAPDRAASAALRAQFVAEHTQHAPDAPIVGTVSRLSPEKGVGDFIAAAALIAQQLPAARFLVVGDGPERAALQAQAQQLGVPAQFLGARADIPALLNCMDVFVLASHAEGQPIAILEAMACAVPVVATNVGGVGSVIVPQATGILVLPHAPEQLAGQVLDLLANPERAHAIGSRARAAVEQHWTLERQARDLYAALCDVGDNAFAS